MQTKNKKLRLNRNTAVNEKKFAKELVYYYHLSNGIES